MQKNVVTVRFYVIAGAIRVGVDCNKKHSKLNYNTDTLIVMKRIVWHIEPSKNIKRPEMLQNIW